MRTKKDRKGERYDGVPVKIPNTCMLGFQSSPIILSSNRWPFLDVACASYPLLKILLELRSIVDDFKLNSDMNLMKYTIRCSLLISAFANRTQTHKQQSGLNKCWLALKINLF